jgi:hypothetical protein
MKCDVQQEECLSKLCLINGGCAGHDEYSKGSEELRVKDNLPAGTYAYLLSEHNLGAKISERLV